MSQSAMHIAPWVNEHLDSSLPPMLRMLKGDFFCAPFGDSDLLEEETRAHGTSANDMWERIDSNNSSIKFKLSKHIMGAELMKEITIADDEHVIYQKHTFVGGAGKIPVGHHAMIKVKSKAYISFSDYIYGGTPPKPVEEDPQTGRSVLKYPQVFSDLTSMKLNDDSVTNVSVYPFNTK